MSCHISGAVLWCGVLTFYNFIISHHSMSISHISSFIREISWCFLCCSHFLFCVTMPYRILLLCTASSRLSNGLHYFVVSIFHPFPCFPVSYWRLSNIIIFIHFSSLTEGGNGIKGISLICCGLYIFFQNTKHTTTMITPSSSSYPLILHHISHHTTNQTNMIPFYLFFLHIPYGYIIGQLERKARSALLVLLCVVFKGYR